MLPPILVRRVLAPVLLCVEVALLVVMAAGVVLGAVAALVSPPRRLLRVSAFAAGYLCVEIATLPLCLALWLRHAGRHGPRWDEDHRRLLDLALRGILSWAGRCVGFRMELDGTLDPLETDGPVLALARHGGPGDSFALVHLLTSSGRCVRIVLKSILQLDPLLDILLNRMGCCFLPSRPRSGEDLPARLGRMAVALGGRDALLVFPEGGNWTPRRRRRAIARLRAEHRHEPARAATLMTNVLPPRPAGVLAVLDARPDLPVLLLAHAGLDRLVSAGDVWRSLPLTTPMVVRVWPTAPVPACGGAGLGGAGGGGAGGGGAGGADEARLSWLTTEWATVDEWVDGWHAGHPSAPGPAPTG